MQIQLPKGKFRCIVADPPWRLNIGNRRTTRGPVKAGKWNDPRQRNDTIAPLAYPTMTIDEIAAIRVSGVADRDAHLYLWTINAHLESTYAVARAWGFRPATLLTWVKAPMGLGLGGTFCNATEFCLFARRGTLKAQCRIDRTWWKWKRGRHSQKPEAFQDMVETVSPGPRLELFARRNRPGWTCWGNEINQDAPAENQGAEPVQRLTAAGQNTGNALELDLWAGTSAMRQKAGGGRC